MVEFLGWLTLGLGIGLVYGILALGIVLVYKGTKVINFAHPFLGLLCAFVCWWLTSNAGFLPFARDSRPRFAVAAVLSLVFIGLQGYVLERTIFHRLQKSSRLTQLVATIAVGSGMVGLVVVLFQRNQEQAEQFRSLPTLIRYSFNIGNVTVQPAYIQMFIVVPIVAGGLYLFFQRSKFGIGIRAAADNPDAARLLGISAARVSQFTWVTGSVLAGVAALLIVPVNQLDVSSLSTGFLVRALAAALVGGLISLPGAIVGGLVVGVTETLTLWQSDSPGLPEVLMFLVVIGVLVFRPGGLFGKPEDTNDEAAFIPALRDLPIRLRLNPVTPWIGRFWMLTAFVFAIAISQVVGGATNGILINIIVAAMVGVSLTVLVGYTGQISLGHWGLVGVGAFATANLLTRFEVPFILAIPGVLFIGMGVSLLIGLPALRIRGLYLAIITLAFNLACELYLFKQDSLSGGSAGQLVNGPKFGPFDLDAIDGKDLFLFSLALLAFSMWVARNLAATRTGRGFFALRENERAAAVLGINLTQYRLLSFAVSGGIAALAGMVFALNQGTIAAVDFPTSRSLVLVSMVVIGGLGSVEGAVLGAIVVFGLPDLFEFANGWVVEIGTGILLIIVITRAPGGLAGVLNLGRREVVSDLVALAEVEGTRGPSGIRERLASAKSGGTAPTETIAVAPEPDPAEASSDGVPASAP